jgi:hypothetical protein
VKRPIVAAIAALSSAALVAAAPAATPKIPLSATYSGKNSQGKSAKIFVSKQGKRVGYTMHVAPLKCTNGASDPGHYWTTEGPYAKDWWIRPTAAGAFAPKSSNQVTLSDGSLAKASAKFKGKFVSGQLVTGTFRGHVDYLNADGSLFTSCGRSA